MRTRAAVLIAAIVLTACQTAAPARLPVAAACGAAFAALGYEDGLAGRPPRDAAGCAMSEREAYRQRYAAGAYVAGLNADTILGAGAGRARGLGGAGVLGGTRRDPALPAGCSPGEARASGRLGQTLPAPCPNLPAVADAFSAGRAEARLDAERSGLDVEQRRLESQLLKPFLTPAERRLIESRINAIERRSRALDVLR